MMATCWSCLGCRTAGPSQREGPVSSADDPPASGVRARPVSNGTVVLAYYFHRTQRCPSCLLLETTASRTIEEHFARQLRAGQVTWTSVDMEDPQREALRRQLEVYINGLVLVRVENGVYEDAKRLDELWGLLGRPDAFSKYLVDEINARLNPMRGG